jgi:hypothetical protein
VGDASGTESTSPGRARALWLRLWSNRTKALGYAGVTAGALYMALQAGEHWQLALLGALVAALGHYNDHVRDVV